MIFSLQHTVGSWQSPYNYLYGKTDLSFVQPKINLL